MIWVFVYGTLLEGEVNHAVAAPYVVQLESGCVRGTLYNYGPYPALVLKGENIVIGEWLQVTDEGLVQMDLLEDYNGPGLCNDYERLWINDAVRPDREGWIYVWNDGRGYPLLSSGSWRTHRKKL
ncbi:gamma-glutamylcyclotransferase family protein [Paenibacillus sp. UNC451MF]|uniref:gamma-glutamylcyclotransferase family protein n=1 Tax=Paenibacillus sp. UNC451MF TaxID=1449063 RepID=UPI00048BA202|nr:gamma-glutamylcyclotransferase family protein [Paenibacillus sp. UNC451MF]